MENDQTLSNRPGRPPVVTPPVDTQKDDQKTLERLLLSLLFFVTVTQFAAWGYQSVIYILSQIFGVFTESTFFDTFIGLIAMIGSALVFAGAWMRWGEQAGASKYMVLGSVAFIVKNSFDLVNEVIRFGQTHANVTAADIESLAALLGAQFFQLAFWVFIYFFFRNK